MKNTKISAILATMLFAVPIAGHGAYPTYPSYQQAYPTYQVNNQVQQQRTTQQVVIPANTTVAASPTRVTGTLPRVGSNATAAGRQYYQPADYDRLADSGLYVGLGVAYSASISGNMSADYTGEAKSYFVPGAFKSASYATDTVIPIQVSVGAAINNDLRVDFSYSRLSGIEYPSEVQTSKGGDGYTPAQVTGGAITSNATMLNVYYNIDSYTGYLMGGVLRPYVGVGVGLALNTIADYVVYDPSFYAYVLEEDLKGLPADILTGVSDVYAYHNGGTSENLAYMIEGGLTTELSGGLKLDMFVRYSGLGKVKNSGSIVMSQTEWLSDGFGGEVQAGYDSVFHYTNWYESGRLSTVDIGIRLRLQF
ncbi:hypothetical protein LJC18_03940 [Lachnospiraceae bacterium OttesenSCG-928-E19]|nr:hypothetical protein [Lachnospiraceae bacterium OttesenSCG-928-E19]